MSHTNIVTIGIDVGKNTFHVVGFGRRRSARTCALSR